MTATGLVFLLLFALGCVLAFLRHPIYGLLTYIGVFYVHPPMRWWGAGLPDVRWSLLAALLTTLAVAASRSRMGQTATVRSDPMFIGIVLFTIWAFVKWPFALDGAEHGELIFLYIKYIVLLWLIVRCLDSDEHVQAFLWAHVVGCFYLGWVAYTEYEGGRFEGFGSPNINEANAGSLHIATGALVGASLFLSSGWFGRAGLLAMMPFIVNAMITTLSRSGFLAAAAGGLMFNVFAPKRLRWVVASLSTLGLVLFFALTNDVYWGRIASLKFGGAEVMGVDTGDDRLVLIRAQAAMFREHPFGCGHRCTAVLSPLYLDDEYMTTSREGIRARSSHNTTMTMLVEHGIVGGAFYLAAGIWVFFRVRKFIRSSREEAAFRATLAPGLAAALMAVFVSDQFVDNLIFEARFWLIGVLIALTRQYSPASPQVRMAPQSASAVTS